MKTEKLMLAANLDGEIKGEFVGVAYSGGTIDQPWLNAAAVIDLAGVKVAPQTPLMYQHSYTAFDRLGTVELTVTASDIKVKGICDATGGVADTIRNEGAKHPWQLSIGTEAIDGDNIEYIQSGEVTVNGRAFPAPLYIIRACVIREVSVVALGADKETEMRITAGATAPAQNTENNNNKIKLSQSEENKMADEKIKAEPAAPAVADSGAVIAELEAKIKKLEARLDAAPAHLPAGKPAVDGAKITAAALAAACGVPEAYRVKKYGEQTVEAAAKSPASISRLVVEAAHKAGFSDWRLTPQNVKEALQLSFSTADIADVIGATANDILRADGEETDQTWREISAIHPATDFKKFDRVLLDGDLAFKKLPRGGEIEHGVLKSDGAEIQVDANARMLVITMQDLVDDNLGAFANLVRKFNFGAWQGFNEQFWAEFTAGTFFDTFAGSALSIDGLKTATAAYRKRKDKFGKYLTGRPEMLLVPPSLEAAALELYKSTNLTGGNTRAAATNIYAGNYRPVVQNILEDDSATTYYLVGNPAGRAMMGVAFLGGVEAPVIETAEANFNTLGIQMRGYFNFGVAKEDKHGGLKVTVA